MNNIMTPKQPNKPNQFNINTELPGSEGESWFGDSVLHIVENMDGVTNVANTVAPIVTDANTVVPDTAIITDSEPNGILSKVDEVIHAMVGGTLIFKNAVENTLSKTWRTIFGAMSGNNPSQSPSAA